MSNTVTTVKVETLKDGALWIECTSCGNGERVEKLAAKAAFTSYSGVELHRSACKAKVVVRFVDGKLDLAVPAGNRTGVDASVFVAIETAPEVEASMAYARNVRRTGLTKGRTEDMVDAIKRGYLTVDDAMNSDD